MPKQQNIENSNLAREDQVYLKSSEREEFGRSQYKSVWHDDYLKWVCAFANAQGGRIYIGKNNAGKVVGLEDYDELMEELPNKIKNLMGITAEVNLSQEDGKYFIEIIVWHYSVPISLRGRYYYRSGSVMQELTGTALNEFLFKSAGLTWDEVVEPRAAFAVREMLLNALIHRTYMGSFVQIRVYDDKISIWNDGNLPERMNLEKLKQLHSSKPRNLIIADVCFKGGLIDAWGRGTVKIIETCLEAGLPEPELIERDGGFLVTLFKNNLTEQLKKLGLNERQVKAIEYVKENGRITNKEYQTLNSISKRTATNDLSELVDKYKLVNKVGFGAGSFYELIGQ